VRPECDLAQPAFAPTIVSLFPPAWPLLWLLVPANAEVPVTPSVVEIEDVAFEVVDAPEVAAAAHAVTYRVVVEPKLRAHADELALVVDDALASETGWAAGGFTFAAVDDEAADITIVLASPKTTDRLCAPLRTGGAFSCGRNGRAVINARRWLHGATTYRGRLAEYRTYVVNHEVGHLLGFEHRTCPHRGAVAPVMLQQTKSLRGCRRATEPRPAELAALVGRPLRYSGAARGSAPAMTVIADAVARASSTRTREGRAVQHSAP
jgi:hypothetical protein